MPTIFDNITTAFLENDSKNGLRDALMVASRADFCVGVRRTRMCVTSLPLKDASGRTDEFMVRS
jgi:hypothetical protein